MRGIFFLWKYSRAMHGSRIRFLKKVCQLVRCTASPKHPQSLIGLNRARYSVSRVKKQHI